MTNNKVRVLRIRKGDSFHQYPGGPVSVATHDAELVRGTQVVIATDRGALWYSTVDNLPLAVQP